jgi:hypothetical protein
MKIFIDESGDSGFKFDKGSSKFFTIAMVIFNDHEEANACEERINLLKRELGHSQNFEFHFIDNSFHIRENLFRAVAPYDFYYYAFVLNKELLYGEGFRNKQSFYKYTTWLLFENAKDKIIDWDIYIDGSGDIEFRQWLTKYLKKKMNDGMKNRICSVKMIPSHKMNLIQLADYVASSVNRRYTKIDDKDTSSSIIAHREIYVQVWPKPLQ